VFVVANSFVVGGGVETFSMGFRWSLMGRCTMRVTGNCFVSVVGRGTWVDGLHTLVMYQYVLLDGNEFTNVGAGLASA
jgi:hypothetical protein